MIASELWECGKQFSCVLLKRLKYDQYKMGTLWARSCHELCLFERQSIAVAKNTPGTTTLDLTYVSASFWLWMLGNP